MDRVSALDYLLSFGSDCLSIVCVSVKVDILIGHSSFSWRSSSVCSNWFNDDKGMYNHESSYGAIVWTDFLPLKKTGQSSMASVK